MRTTGKLGIRKKSICFTSVQNMEVIQGKKYKLWKLTIYRGLSVARCCQNWRILKVALVPVGSYSRHKTAVILMVDPRNGPTAMPWLQSHLAVINRTPAKWSWSFFVKDNCNQLTLTKHFVDILLDETVVKETIFYDLHSNARPGGRQSSSLRKSKTGKSSDASKSCDFKCCLFH